MNCDAPDSSLLAIFADEARAHLGCLDAGLDALDRAAMAARPALVTSLRDTLHTLAGAARAVSLADLESLCRALENMLAAVSRAGAAFDGEPLARLHQAVALARLLTRRPDPRGRNVAVAMIAQLDATACQLAAPVSA